MATHRATYGATYRELERKCLTSHLSNFRVDFEKTLMKVTDLPYGQGTLVLVLVLVLVIAIVLVLGTRY